MLRKTLLLAFSLLSTTMVNAATKMQCTTGTNDFITKAEMIVDDKTLVFNSTLYIKGKKTDLGAGLIVLKKRREVYQGETTHDSRTVSKHHVFTFNDWQLMSFESAKIEDGYLVGIFSTEYKCVKSN